MATPIDEFRLPRVVVSGAGCLGRLGEEARALGIRRALVVTDPGVARLPGLAAALGRLESAGVAARVFAGVVPEPLTPCVEAGLAAYREGECDGLVAVGGGSSIDVAKCVGVLATSGGRIAQYEGANRVPGPKPPLLAVPTTAGTGSEVTRFAVVTDVERDVKMLIASPHLIPDVAIVDPELTLTLPPDVTRDTGVDALTHAVEAYVSRRAQLLTDALALEAIRLVAGSLRPAWANGDDAEARARMSRASLLAGMAFGNASVALVHGMARPLGAHFHLSHGLANATLLTTVMEYSLVGSPARYAAIAAALGEDVAGRPAMAAARQAVAAVRELAADVGVPSLYRALARAGFGEEALRSLAPKLAQDALASGSPANNPRRPTAAEIVELYERASAAE